VTLPGSAAQADTVDLRTGPPVHDSLLALLPLVGTWLGTGSGVVASTGAQFRYGQQVRIGHDGRPFLAYESRSWLIDEHGVLIRQAWRESGYWRAGPDPDDVELVIASNTGQALVFRGTAGDASWDLESISAAHAPSAKDVAGERRLYAIRTEELAYATELAPAGESYAPHLNARLARVGSSELR
jgi:THAP4-like, heme-binding beta-barrel domain